MELGTETAIKASQQGKERAFHLLVENFKTLTNKELLFQTPEPFGLALLLWFTDAGAQ